MFNWDEDLRIYAEMEVKNSCLSAKSLGNAGLSLGWGGFTAQVFLLLGGL